MKYLVFILMFICTLGYSQGLDPRSIEEAPQTGTVLLGQNDVFGIRYDHYIPVDIPAYILNDEICVIVLEDTACFPLTEEIIYSVLDTTGNTGFARGFVVFGDQGDTSRIALNDSLYILGGDGIRTEMFTDSTNSTKDSLIIHHDNTSDAPSVSLGDDYFLMGITIDTFGHILAYDSARIYYDNGVLYVNELTYNIPTGGVQTIDTFELVGNQIRISLSGDNQAYKFIDVSEFRDTQSLVTVNDSTIALTWPNSLVVKDQIVFRLNTIGVGGSSVWYTDGNNIYYFSAGDTIYWDGANGRLGIGTNVPKYRLDVDGSVNVVDSLFLPGTLSINNTLTYVLVRDPITGLIELRDVSTIGGSSTDDQVINLFDILNDDLRISIEDDGVGPLTVDLNPYRDTAQLDTFLLINDTVFISFEEDDVPAYSLDVTSLLDNQTIDLLQLTNGTMEISLENDGELPQPLDLTPLLILDTFRLDGNNLELSFNDRDELNILDLSSLAGGGSPTLTIDSTGAGGTLRTFSLSAGANTVKFDESDDQDLSLAANILSLEGDPSTVDLSGYLDNTDDQTVDQFELIGTTLNLSLESDGQAAYTADLSSLQSTDLNFAEDNLTLTGDRTHNFANNSMNFNNVDSFVINGATTWHRINSSNTAYVQSSASSTGNSMIIMNAHGATNSSLLNFTKPNYIWNWELTPDNEFLLEYITPSGSGEILAFPVDPPAGGVIQFSSDVTVPDEAYGVSWDASLEVPTKNALYDKIETMAGGQNLTVPVSTTEIDITGGTGVNLVGGNEITITRVNANQLSFATHSLYTLDVTSDAAGTITVTDGETLGILGGTNITTTHSGNNVTINADNQGNSTTISSWTAAASTTDMTLTLSSGSSATLDIDEQVRDVVGANFGNGLSYADASASGFTINMDYVVDNLDNLDIAGNKIGYTGATATSSIQFASTGNISVDAGGSGDILSLSGDGAVQVNSGGVNTFISPNGIVGIGNSSNNGSTAEWMAIESNGFGFQINQTTEFEITAASVQVNGGVTGTYNFEVNGDAGKTTGGTLWTDASDSRLKRNVKTISNPYEVISNLRPVEYYYKDKYIDEWGLTAKKRTGYIAQEYMKVIPEDVTLESNGFYSLTPEAVGPYTVAAVQQLILENRAQKAQIEQLYRMIKRLR